MISKETVLVLGAGASAPFGFSLGSGLCQTIRDPAKFAPHAKALCEAGLSDTDVAEFQTQFRDSRQTSLDAYIEELCADDQREQANVGKMAMAAILLAEERSSEKLFTDGSHWYDHLLTKLGKYEEFDGDRLKIVTFNYDRSLRHFLLKATKNRWGRSLGECVEKVNVIEVVHVHGELGLLPEFVSPQTSWATKYGAEPTRAALDEAIKRIRLAGDPIKSIASPTYLRFLEAQKAIANAERVYFIGFAYAERNVERLLKDVAFKHTARGTAYKMPKLERERTLELFKNRGMKLDLHEMDALTFLREEAPLD